MRPRARSKSLSGWLLPVMPALLLVAAVACGGGDQKATPVVNSTATVPESQLAALVDAAALPAISGGFTVRDVPNLASGCGASSQCMPGAPKLVKVYGNDKGVVLTIQVSDGLDSNEGHSEYNKLIDSYDRLAVGDYKKLGEGLVFVH